jgi:Flp pilus assembly pilin Flp
MRVVVQPEPASDIEIPTEDARVTCRPALAALVEERLAAQQAAVDAAIRASVVVLPPATWREIQERAASVGVDRRAERRRRPPPAIGRSGPGSRRRRQRVVTMGRAGQGLVEYGLILAFTALLTTLWLVVFGGTVSDALTAIAVAIDRATGG